MASCFIRLGLARRRRYMGPDARVDRLEERERRHALDLRLTVAVAVEYDVGKNRQAPVQQVHQQEGEIVEHVDAGDRPAELDAVEEQGSTFHEADVAQMQIAMTEADLAREPAILHQLLHPLEPFPAAAIEIRRAVRREQCR